MKSIKIIISAILLNYFALSVSNSEVINQIEIEGNKRITDEIILMFSEIDIGQDITSSAVNEIIKNLYETNFFNNVSVVFDKNLVSITVDEAPIIDKIFLNGIKAKKIEQKIKDDLILKSRSSYNEF
ncbi:outer membrane protein assembly factor BamA, partial [Candidatus Pelagibacter sp.]|nr:outer membrane protein assembly factor BamA [Candidatus Pelagibacter sp.]